MCVCYFVDFAKALRLLHNQTRVEVGGLTSDVVHKAEQILRQECGAQCVEAFDSSHGRVAGATCGRVRSYMK